MYHPNGGGLESWPNAFQGRIPTCRAPVTVDLETVSWVLLKTAVKKNTNSPLVSVSARDLWIPIQICIFSFISGAQFFLQGRASFLATRFLVWVVGLWLVMQACAYRNLSVQYFKADSSRESSPSCERGNRPFLMDNSDMILYLSYWYTGRRVAHPSQFASPCHLTHLRSSPLGWLGFGRLRN